MHVFFAARPGHVSVNSGKHITSRRKGKGHIVSSCWQCRQVLGSELTRRGAWASLESLMYGNRQLGISTLARALIITCCRFSYMKNSLPCGGPPKQRRALPKGLLFATRQHPDLEEKDADDTAEMFDYPCDDRQHLCVFAAIHRNRVPPDWFLQHSLHLFPEPGDREDGWDTRGSCGSRQPNHGR